MDASSHFSAFCSVHSPHVEVRRSSSRESRSKRLNHLAWQLWEGRTPCNQKKRHSGDYHENTIINPTRLLGLAFTLLEFRLWHGLCCWCYESNQHNFLVELNLLSRMVATPMCLPSTLLSKRGRLDYFIPISFASPL